MTTTPHPRSAASDQPDETVEAGFDRRSLLRRAGTVIAVAGGAAAVTAVTGGTAHAANGDPLTAGGAFTATSGTSLSSNVTGTSTLTLTNSASRAPLTLADSGAGALSGTVGMPAGSLLNSGGALYYVDDASLGSQWLVHTDFNTNQIVPISPVRVLDTRIAQDAAGKGGRTNILSDPSWSDAAFRLKGGQWIEVDLSKLALYADVAFVNLTAVSPTGGGYLSMGPAKTVGAPTTSAINYSKNVTIANGGVAPLSAGVSVFIFASATTHVLLDVTAFNSAPGLVSADPAVKATAARAATRRTAMAAASALRAGG